ncbi:natural killer cell receptor 2B4 [Mauremys reevesii]|uniref:natural killer cell receptor 2B4 n=1 Tax=Mauremys reevesii TaxID=260615 RepID=UPI00193FBE6C|nr:natural killer cell receptor 2B4 [Mauremys reevesii]XP_039368309.1 natural killer cell receptor 2B4 [Mauremys reevesii]XP_039368311.1 natural killer cell receptor 2B4 [Mauremys reevesii]XP_039368312.1 natural killer cell receptor 2B4 [Mauremys reevesii]XP_039368313.1 natural killer cell receptor 2B4 [Mauremys reevesii]XP_039368314.1 natural killer cell receptor 2B4 [Mauremys reevesii]XP_039368315.1 natural killer cell receptor 2B4 [Mauremys reevesii]
MRISLCLLLFSVVHGGGCKEMEVAAIAGESVQLQPVKLPEPWAEMTWDVTLDSAQTYGIVTFNKGEPPDLGSSPHFISRVTFHPENLSLQIEPVNKSDSGLYTLRIDIGGGREDITKFRVSVFDRVRQPNLMVLSAHPELGQCNATLSCSVPGADRVTYSWSRGTSWIPSERDHQLPGNQSLLHLVINANSSDVFYRCNASNQVSWDADTIDVKSSCDSPATALTPGIKQQAFSLTDFFQKVPLWAIVAAGLGLLLLLMALALIFLCKHRKKQRSCKDSDPPLTIYEEVEDACPRRNANGNAESRIVGNTIYAEINSNPQVADFTVYAAVQRPPSVKRKKINPSFISTIYSEVQEAPSRPRRPQMPRPSSPNPVHLYS